MKAGATPSYGPYISLLNLSLANNGKTNRALSLYWKPIEEVVSIFGHCRLALVVVAVMHDTIGATDETGMTAVEDVHHIRDFHVSLLRLLGLDHNRLT